MKLRLPARLLAALMLLPAAFGIGGSLIATERTPQSIVCPYRQHRREPPAVEDRLQAVVQVLPAGPVTVRRATHLPVLFDCYELFQRPPPDAFLFA